MTGHPSVKEAIFIQNEAWNIMIERLFEYKDVSTAHGFPWQESLTFTVRLLKYVGYGKSSFEILCDE